MKRKIFKCLTLFVIFVTVTLLMCACEGDASYSSQLDTANTKEIADRMQNNQPTPSDIDYSLERYNLIRRAYWVNGQREKANVLECPIEKPLGYIALFTESGSIIEKFIVDGKVSSLNSFLTPDSEYFEIATGAQSTYRNKWLSDVDGSYGENDSGIFFCIVGRS